MITSRSNPYIKEIRVLHDRRRREESGLFVVEGIRIVAEAVQVGATIEQMVVAPTLLTSDYGRKVVADWQQASKPFLEVSADVFRSISVKDNPQGLGAVIRQRWTDVKEAPTESQQLWVALSNIQDAGNLGTILRTADAVGCAGAILVGHTTDPFDPVAVRASMGAIFSQALLRTTLGELISWKTNHALTLVGTSDSAPVDYQAVVYPQRLIVFMGSEQHGLSTEEQAACDLMVQIPMVGRSDSLNVAVASGVVLYEIFNQHRKVKETAEEEIRLDPSSAPVTTD